MPTPHSTLVGLGHGKKKGTKMGQETLFVLHMQIVPGLWQGNHLGLGKRLPDQGNVLTAQVPGLPPPEKEGGPIESIAWLKRIAGEVNHTGMKDGEVAPPKKTILFLA